MQKQKKTEKLKYDQAKLDNFVAQGWKTQIYPAEKHFDVGMFGFTLQNNGINPYG